MSSQNLAIGATPAAPHFTALPPLALYIHIPWCLKKCPYCDFNSHEQRQALPEARYVDALLTDLETALPSIWGRRFSSIFFGGGTPSLFSPSSIDAILAGVRARMPVPPGTEVTLEANPGTFEARKFAEFRDAGINRLSIGIQSFNPEHLRALGRVHDDSEAHRAVEIGLATIGNINLDLMYALPGQSLAQAENDLRTALAYAPPHLSAYHLTLEPNTLFARHPPQLPDDESAADMQDAIEALLAGAGYSHYETSAYAQPGRECRHNRNYWEFGDYLGIGAGAHSKLSLPNRIFRQVRYKQPQQYLDMVEAGTPVIEAHDVPRADVGFEFMLNALRLNDGVPVALFQERTGFPLPLVEAGLRQAEAKGLLLRDHQRIAPTELGRRFLNDLQQLFLA
ncbi:MAG: oxygen-independent coproporphyrinogen III oxidase-like protein [Burkholderiales bacterium]|nr:oxygen-independent coproporphyrinogen III oxidase-like protein [Burkholderiales bacterium]